MFKENIHPINGESYLDDTNLIASVVSKLTKEAGTMLPKEPEEIKKLLVHSATVVVWDGLRETSPIAFGAVTFDWPGEWKELGAIVVDKNYRQKGIGHRVVGNLIKAAKYKYPYSNLFALCNEKSLKLFLDHGAEIITEPGILPPEVFGECANCPKFQETKNLGKLCCDVPVLVAKAEKIELLDNLR